MDTNRESFWQFVWKVSKSPLKHFKSSPMSQSAAAVGVNFWCLLLAVLAQFWVLFSAILLTAQTYNTWLVLQGRMSSSMALTIGLVIVAINFAALSLAVLGQLLGDDIQGRTSDEQITLYKSLGMTAKDLYAAQHVLDKALRAGIGTPIEL